MMLTLLVERPLYEFLLSGTQVLMSAADTEQMAQIGLPNRNYEDLLKTPEELADEEVETMMPQVQDAFNEMMPAMKEAYKKIAKLGIELTTPKEPGKK